MFLIEILEVQVKVLVEMQYEGGFWYILLDDLDLYLEVFVVVGFVYGILKVVCKGYISDEYVLCVIKVIKVVLENIDEIGELQQVLFGILVFDDLQGYCDILLIFMLYGQFMVIFVLVEFMNVYI